MPFDTQDQFHQELLARLNTLGQKLHDTFEVFEQQTARASVIGYLEQFPNDSAAQRFLAGYHGGRWKLIMLTENDLKKVYAGLTGDQVTAESVGGFALHPSPYIYLPRGLPVEWLASVAIHEGTHGEGLGEFRAWGRQAAFMRRHNIAVPEDSMGGPLDTYLGEKGPRRLLEFGAKLGMGYPTKKIAHPGSIERRHEPVRRALLAAALVQREREAQKRALKKILDDIGSLLGKPLG